DDRRALGLAARPEVEIGPVGQLGLVGVRGLDREEADSPGELLARLVLAGEAGVGVVVEAERLGGLERRTRRARPLHDRLGLLLSSPLGVGGSRRAAGPVALHERQ